MNSTQKIRTLLLCVALVLTASHAYAQQVEHTQKVAPGIYEIVFNPTQNALYVAAVGARGESNGYVYELRADDLAVVDSIAVSEAPAFGLGFNKATQTLYTSNTRSNSVHAIDVETGKVVATITHGGEKSHTRELVVDEAANRIYVSDVSPGGIWVIDGATNTFSHLIENAGDRPAGLALDAAEQRLYVSNLGTNEITVIDLASEQIVKTYSSQGESPINVALDAAGDRLFVTNQKSGTVAVLNASAGTPLATIETGEGALGVTYDDARNRLYVANRQAGTVSVVDAETYAVIATLETGTHPNTIALDPESGAVFVTNKARSTRGQENPMPDPNGDTVAKIIQ